MIKITFLVVLLFLPASIITAQNEGLNKIFSSAIQAVGDEKEIKKIRSLEAFAECLSPKGSYSTEIISTREDKTRFKQDFTYKNASTDIFINDKSAWNNNEFSLVPPFQKLVVHLHEYQKMAFDFQRMFHDFAFEGTEVFANRPSHKVRAKHELDGTIFLYFDVETKLLSGYVLPIPNSNESVKNVFNEWKTIGKIKIPSKVTATDSSGDFILNFKKITFNKTDPKIFNIPLRINDLTELLRLHEQQKTAHLNYNAGLFVEMFAENLTQIQRGNVSTHTKAENLTRIKNYFGSFKFIEWENLKPPVIKISGDGTMATILVQKRVRGTYRNEKNEEVLDQTDFAWLEVWDKIDNKWKISAVASTEKVVQNSK